jgi:hypothetical protein
MLLSTGILIAKKVSSKRPTMLDHVLANILSSGHTISQEAAMGVGAPDPAFHPPVIDDPAQSFCSRLSAGPSSALFNTWLFQLGRVYALKANYRSLYFNGVAVNDDGWSYNVSLRW